MDKHSTLDHDAQMRAHYLGEDPQIQLTPPRTRVMRGEDGEMISVLEPTKFTVTKNAQVLHP